MSRYLLRLAMLTIALACASPLIVPGQFTDPLNPYTTCKVSGDLQIKEITRRNAESHYREVKTAKGKQKVSLLDGYRVMFAYPDLTYFFANVKIEQSEPNNYVQDKETLVSELKYASQEKANTAMIFADKTMLNGFEHYGTDRDKIDVGGVIGIHTLFYDPAHLVVTIYFLNQEKASARNNRRFDSIKEYIRLRDEFLNHYSQCLKGIADKQH